MKSYKHQNPELHHIQLELMQLQHSCDQLAQVVATGSLFSADVQAFKVKTDSTLGLLHQIAIDRQRGDV